MSILLSAHYLAAYMFTTTCSGDQSEFDTLAYMSTGRDKRLVLMTMIVLAAMLQRTEGFRARQCRNMLLENRGTDFEEGVSLYDRFLRSAEKRFAEEDFLVDTHTQIQRLHEHEETIVRQRKQIITLENTITTMEQKYTQIIGTQYNIGKQNVFKAPITINKYYGTTIDKEKAENIGEEKVSAYSKKEQARTTKNDLDNTALSREILSVPNKGKYSEVRKYIAERCRFDEEFKQFVASHTRVELCARLSNEFGWDVDEHALGVNMNRNR